MGCCISRPSGPNSPYPGGVGASASARAINGDPSQPAGAGAPTMGTGAGGLPSPGSGTSSGRRQPRHRHHHNQPLSQHINKPLRRHEWSSRNRVWTAAALRRERVEFFDTRVTGRQEIWQTLRTALEVMWDAETARRAQQHKEDAGNETDHGADAEGPSGEDDATVALATAQSILDAADITLPTGDLAQGAYDALGNYYPIPEQVVSDPINISRRPDSRGELGDAKGDLTAGEDTAEEGDPGDDDDDDDAERRREEKGKGVLDVRDQMTVRARLSEGSQDVTITVGRADSVRSIARRVAEEASLPFSKKIRLAYMGKILKEGSSLSSQGWKPGHVVNALVFNR